MKYAPITTRIITIFTGMSRKRVLFKRQNRRRKSDFVGQVVYIVLSTILRTYFFSRFATSNFTSNEYGGSPRQRALNNSEI